MWGPDPYCPRCGNQKINEAKRDFHFWCGSCRKHFTVRTNTMMATSNMPLRKWFFAMYFLVTARKGVSSLQLSKELSISQRTAWYLLHRLREACASGPDLLSGHVEVDETFLGGKETNKHSYKKLGNMGHEGKTIVMGLRQREGQTVGRHISATDRLTLWTEIQKHVSKGTTIYTDDHPVYRGLERKEYTHESVNHRQKEYVRGDAHTNSMESVWAVMKRGYVGTYHHWSDKHTQRYVNEFTFRLNAGDVQHDTWDRMIALCQCLKGKKLKYKELTAN